MYYSLNSSLSISYEEQSFHIIKIKYKIDTVLFKTEYMVFLFRHSRIIDHKGEFEDMVKVGIKMAKTHELKITPKYFKDVVDGDKNFELRKNDRDFKVGDSLMLKEFDSGAYKGDSVQVVVTYILVGGEYSLDKDYVILGIE